MTLSTKTFTFPTEVLERLFAFSMLDMPLQQRVGQAQALSLVARGWTRLAQKMALSSVQVKGRQAMMRFNRRVDQLDAAGVVRALTIFCQTSSTDSSNLTPTGEWISPTDLHTTLNRTPKLARLAIYQPDFSLLPPDVEALGSSSAIRNLTSFALTALPHNTSETLITTLLENTPLLRALTLSGGPVATSHRFRPVQRFPPKLRVLVVDGMFYNSILFDGGDPLMPIEAYAALEELAVPIAFGAARLAPDLLEKAADTLRTLIIPVQGLSPLWHHLAGLTSLVNLVIGSLTPTMESLPSTAFAALPSSLRYLSIRNINLWGQEPLLQHLKCDLEVLDVGWSWYPGLLSALPPSLRTIKVAPHAQLAPDLFTLAQASPSRRGLEKIELCPSAGEAVDAVYLRSIEWACGVLGVTLVVK
ncbi:hypothetical protein BCR35DRAFT_303587 [Leucosporidium creatinivorum]|uniref:Uncharacterized protein n=1 Tax=Leucosporidium creatinivorum TaxID=106004 RepID=A0A1Y2FHR8_9BASI|nr:hypothetical protein BCR35DRAFT_303587 [Leucosporidium creatinivorum]